MVGAAAGTVENYRLALGHWKRVVGPLALDRIDARTVAAFAAELLRTLAPPSVNGHLRAVKAILRFAADDDLALILKAPKITMLREPRRVPLGFMIDEFSKILATATATPGRIGGSPAGVWWRALLLVAWETGLRYRALLSILAVDFLPEQGGLLVRAETQKDREGQWFFLPPNTIAAVQRIVVPSEPLLFHPGVKVEQVGRWFRSILDRSGIYAPKGSGMRWHRVRRSKASYTEAAGGDAQRALGHSARSVTERYLDPRIVGRGRQPWMPVPK
jgi:integrase